MAGWHEFRDPIHTFIRVNDEERQVIDSAPAQRLRHIHQLAMTYLVYPGATHRRFEHSLGVMELAGQVFDAVTRTDQIHSALPEELRSRLVHDTKAGQRSYWRQILRVAALCHDIGHLPFSHVAEDHLLPTNWTRHERYTVALIQSEPMELLWHAQRPQLVSEEIAKLAVGQEHFTETPLNDWETILSEIIVGDAFGVDRMDYLLRDSLHAGVAYGRFDYARLVDTLRILPSPPSEDGTRSQEPQLGVEHGGLHAAEALILARYFMFTQVYCHRVRRIYDIHLRDFLGPYLAGRFPSGKFPSDIDQYMELTDAEIIAALNSAARDSEAPGHDPARCIVQRNHYRRLWERSPDDALHNPNIGSVILAEAQQEFGEDAIKRDTYTEKNEPLDFPVLLSSGEVVSARSLSVVLRNLPATSFDFVFVRPDLFNQAKNWLDGKRPRLREQGPTEEES